MPILTTKLYIPSRLPDVVNRSRLIERLNEGLHRKLTLISAPAGFGKTTIITSWLEQTNLPVAWLSLDDSDSDLSRFLTYLVATLQILDESIGKGLLTTLQSPQLPPVAMLLTPLLNDIAGMTDFILVLDDYHVIDSAQIDEALSFLLDHMPPQMHIVMTTREDPRLPLARLRSRGQLTELRATDLRFTVDEAGQFLSQTMGIDLSSDSIKALEKRTEGWIVGLQLAAVSMQNQADKSAFIEAFSGSHRYVLDYLVEEVLQQQSDDIQDFLLQTSILERFCADLCDAVTGNNNSEQILHYLERVNLFIIPLDNERRWYRYHHLFGDLLRQRLRQNTSGIVDLHQRAGEWYEDNGFIMDAFHHATYTDDMPRIIHLIKGDGMPLYYRGAMSAILHWIESLPESTLNDYPALWVIYGTVLSITGRNTEVEEKLQAAEIRLEDLDSDDEIRDLIGQIAALRAILAAPFYHTQRSISQAEEALNFLSPDNLAVRSVVICTLGVAYLFEGNRSGAQDALTQALSMSEKTGNTFIEMLSASTLGIIQENNTDLHSAKDSFQRVIELAGTPPLPISCEAYFGMARLFYEWNEPDKAIDYAEKSITLADGIENIDTTANVLIFLAHVSLMKDDVASTQNYLAKAQQSLEQGQFDNFSEILIDVQTRLLIKQGNFNALETVAKDYAPAQARLYLAQDDVENALDLLDRHLQQLSDDDAPDERLKTLILKALAHDADDDVSPALDSLNRALQMAQAGRYIRLFLDEGSVMQSLLSKASSQGIHPGYVATLLDAFPEMVTDPRQAGNQALIEPLSERELEILQLLADGLSNRDISERLFLALSTVKGHNRNIYGKLAVSRRTEAIARARELGLLSS